MLIPVDAIPDIMTNLERMEQKQYEMDYSQDLKTYTDKVETYMNNHEREHRRLLHSLFTKIKGAILERCSYLARDQYNRSP